MNKVFIVIMLTVFCINAKEKMKIGITLHPYYSFVANIVKDRAEVIPMVEGNVNSHNYQIRPADIELATKLDAVVLNGIGHDEFAIGILKSSGMYKKIPLIYANENIPLSSQSEGGKRINSHTFISFDKSAVQIYTIAKKLGEIDRLNADFYNKNARQYVKKLRSIKSKYMEQTLKQNDKNLKCATIHGGYSDFLKEFGLSVVSVIEKSHGINPTASELKNEIELLKEKGVKIIFAEKDYPNAFINTIQKETGVKVVTLSHLSSGNYSADYFEMGMEYNCKKLSGAFNE